MPVAALLSGLRCKRAIMLLAPTPQTIRSQRCLWSCVGVFYFVR